MAGARPAASGLSWGVSRRFVEYVRRSGGTIVAFGDAIVDSTGMSSWPLAEIDGPLEGPARLRFSGSMRFSAHFGALDVDIAEPVLEVADGGGVLAVRDAATGTERVLARFAWSEGPAIPGARCRIGDPVELDASATVLFGGAYPAGMRLDPLIVVLAD